MSAADTVGTAGVYAQHWQRAKDALCICASGTIVLNRSNKIVPLLLLMCFCTLGPILEGVCCFQQRVTYHLLSSHPTFHNCSMKVRCSCESLATGFATNFVLLAGVNSNSSTTASACRAYPTYGAPCILVCAASQPG